MGIPMLTSFMRQYFTGWKEKELKGFLVIDGDALCHQLYEFDWRSGGQYLEYRDHAIEYFTALKASDIEPLVVFDGIDYTLKKADTIEKRYEDGVKELIGQFSASELATDSLSPSGSRNHKIVLPRFIKKVLSMVLSELSISYVVVDGEADDDMVRLANFHSCPVLSNDSDFYIYALKGGFVHMENFDWRAKPITAKVYYLKELIEQFNLSDGSLRFIIPAIFGNDFISSIVPAAPRYFSSHIKQVTLLPATHPTLSVVAYASHYDNLQDFVNRITSVDRRYLNISKQITLRDNCIKSEEIYDIQEENSLEDLYSKTELRILEEFDIPKWLLNQYRCLDTGTRLMFMMVLGSLRLPIMVEDPNKPSSHYFSRPLRQAAYSIVGLDDVVEGIRIMDDIHESVEIPCCTITYDGQTVELDVIPTMALHSRKKIIYFFLHSDMDVIESIDEKWRLVTASVIFWNNTAKIPLLTLKVLLLTFVICSSASSMIVQLSEGIKMSPNFKHGPQWLEGLHSFAQWQCCYHDASSLNSVLQMPLEFYSPAFLYSGEFALKLYFLSLSADCGISPVLSKLPEESQALYHQLLSTVLSHKSVCRTKDKNILTKESILECKAVEYNIH